MRRTATVMPLLLALLGAALSAPSPTWSADSTGSHMSGSMSDAVSRIAPPDRPPATLARDDGGPSKQKPSTSRKPTYNPPKPGRPWRTIGGATRSLGGPLPDLAVLAPNDHAGRTLAEQPTLYFYISGTPTTPVEFTLLDEEGIAPLVETELSLHAGGGIQPVRLADYGVTLEPGKHYQWFIALVQDREHRSKDVVAEAGIQRMTPQAEVTSRLLRTEGAESAFVYAEAGLWYDALAAVSELIAADPTDEELLVLRRALLEQVELDNAIRSPARLSTPNAG